MENNNNNISNYNNNNNINNSENNNNNNTVTKSASSDYSYRNTDNCGGIIVGHYKPPHPQPIRDNIIESCNFDKSKYRDKSIAIKPTDIIIYGVLIIYYAPLKRKINVRNVFGQKITGRSRYQYDNSSDIFYIDNKLMVLKRLTNRAVSIMKLRFVHYDGRILELIDSNKKSQGLQVGTIMNTFLDFCGGKLPQNIITFHPIICELFHFLIDTFLVQYSLANGKMFVHYVMSKLNSNDDSQSTFFELKRKKHKLKTRTVVDKTNKRKSCDDDDDNNNKKKKLKCTNYMFQDQSLVITDCNPYTCCSISINIPKKFINNKCYFSQRKVTREEYENNGSFICKDFADMLKSGINGYFNPTKRQRKN